jgi:drug/metabolite transporter (DMT)-like permease
VGRTFNTSGAAAPSDSLCDTRGQSEFLSDLLIGFGVMKWTQGDYMSYWLGVVLAIGAGVSTNLGSVFQKKVVNDLPPEQKDQRFFRTLIRKPLWFTGLLLQYAVAASLVILAEVYIGPALVPGLRASGLIVLAVGSVKIVGESLRRQEVLGISMLMLGTIFFSLSELEIIIPEYDFLATDFLLRLGLFTITLIIVILLLEGLRRVRRQYRAIARALVSGILLAMSAYWIAVLIATIVHVFAGTFVLVEFVLFAMTCVVLVVANILAVGTIQDAFKTGNASLLIPIQQVPYLIIPSFVFLTVFSLTPPTGLSMIWFLSGIILTMASSFLLGRRQVLLEEIQ